jgi:hypothetical protein
MIGRNGPPRQWSLPLGSTASRRLMQNSPHYRLTLATVLLARYLHPESGPAANLLQKQRVATDAKGPNTASI